jgi:flagellar biosynthesis/type III secretory pathway protein FliH
MNMLGSEDQLRVLVNPTEVMHVQSSKEFWQELNLALTSLQVVPDERVKKGGCMLEGATGTIDARLDAMQNILLKELQNFIQESCTKEEP